MAQPTEDDLKFLEWGFLGDAFAPLSAGVSVSEDSTWALLGNVFDPVEGGAGPPAPTFRSRNLIIIN